MKDSSRMKGGGSLKGPFNGKYYQTYAKYFVRFLEEYAKQGIKYWAITIQNEPSTGQYPDYRWQTMYLNATQQRGFSNVLLSPALKKSEVGKQILIMAHDHNRDEVFEVAKEIYADPQQDDAIDGIGVHWYSSGNYENLKKVHKLNKDKFLLATEACTGFIQGEQIPLLGDWKRGELYGLDILNDLKNWVTGWTDWNLALDLEGGPNWVKNFVDAPIIVNATADEFYKQPMYYFLGHLSKFVLPDSVRIWSDIQASEEFYFSSSPSVEHIAFQRPFNNEKLVVLINKSANKTFLVSIEDAEMKGKSAQIVLQPKSITTAIWKAATPEKIEASKAKKVENLSVSTAALVFIAILNCFM